MNNRDPRVRRMGTGSVCLAVLMAIFMFSLAGIPPLAGFFAKLYVFSGAVEAGLTWLAVIGVINSAIGAFYYLRVTVSIFMTDPAAGAVHAAKPRWPVMATVVIAALGRGVLGLWQWPLLQVITQGVSTLALR